ncbi:single-stranded-DNA-specific exonuclease RecJ [Clostridium swellfunianum]|uniref:single-stranded-DNA-specific exonuclease RecJ n=1 Tax=Clostridium swellfunianum TaxID=1367462 RepID=UPI00202F99FC|nr:single-stranded-DNA-specific exonuclease RecJ [Clostridium swellfunianum]MCM0650491.1 single-stranded-DNA-specific exonuclease RecJ [Clostridium swellfunianum]
MKKKWLIRKTSAPVLELSKTTGLSDTIVTILANRGIKEASEIDKFVKASIKDLYNPLLMKDMDRGTEIIKEAIINNKNIVIYGDYDVDGVTSTVVLYKALKYCRANVKYYIPDREHEGYGINSERIRMLKAEGAEVILTCDNGISAIEQTQVAKDLGLTVVITDHHEVPFVEDNKGIRSYVIPNADAVINPKQQDCSYPFKLLCGAGIAYKFSTALFKKVGADLNYLDELIEFAGIGTICDVVDLIGENRIIAKNALFKLTSTKNIGLDALMDVLGIKGKKISAGTIGFQIGPCINATGRLETAALSVELLLCEDKERAMELALLLSDLNKKRQFMTTKNVEEIIQLIENSDLKNDKVLVVFKEDVHESIAGIVAGKIKERFNVPTIVITGGKEMPKGSGRSIEEYNLFEELLKCKNLIEKFGGHPMAAGLSIKKDNIALLRRQLNDNCSLNSEDLLPKIRIDRRIPLNIISLSLIQQLEILEPFGKGNETPVFAEKDVLIDKFYIFGKEANVLKFNLIMEGTGRRIDAVYYDGVEEFKELLRERYGEEYINLLSDYNYSKDKIKIDIIFYPYINHYNGIDYLQLRISTFRLSKP